MKTSRRIAKSITEQALLGLDFLHQHKIAHGGLSHQCFFFVYFFYITTQKKHLESDAHFIQISILAIFSFHLKRYWRRVRHDSIEASGTPEIGHVYRSDGKDLESGIPKYIVRPARSSSLPFVQDTRLSILANRSCRKIPRVLFIRRYQFARLKLYLGILGLSCGSLEPGVLGKKSCGVLNLVNLWQIFEIFVGQPPFDSFLITPKLLVGQMQELTHEPLPERWLRLWETMSGDVAAEDPKTRLQEWLEKMYFDGERKADLTSQDIARLGHIIQKLLRFEPSARASAREILDDPFFRD